MAKRPRRSLPNQQQFATIMNFLNGFELSGSLGLSVGTGILRNILAGHKEDIAVVLSRHRCWLQNLNMVQVWSILIVHYLCRHVQLSTLGLWDTRGW